MSRFNLSILLSTALLGVLLWLVLGIVDKAGRPAQQPPDAAEETVTETATQSIDPSLPRINTAEDLEAYLDARALNGTAAMRLTLAWFEARGFLGADELFARSPEEAPEFALEPYDDASLLALAGEGNLGAMQVLAERSLATDPVDAIDWFRRAASHGSVDAMISIGFLLNTWSGPTVAQAFAADPDYLENINELMEPISEPGQEGMAWLLTAAMTGGLPVFRVGKLDSMLQSAATVLGPEATQAACARSEHLVLELAAERRARGELVFNDDPPPLFFSKQTLDEMLPCRIPLIPVVDTTDCEANTVVTRRAVVQTLWICGVRGRG